MSKKEPAVRDLSEEAKANIREGAAKRSEKAVLANIATVRAAKEEIEKEVKDNDGLYPHPKKLTLAEVARRADVTLTVLYKEPYKEFVTELRKWLDKLHEQQELLKQGRPGKQPSPRRSLQERVQDWKAVYDRLKDSHLKTEIDLLAANEEIKTLRQTVDELQGKLREQAELRVVHMPKRDRGTPRGQRRIQGKPIQKRKD